MNAKKKSIKSDLKRVDKLRDGQIDYSDIPALDDTFFTKAVVELPKIKDVVTLRIDHEILQWFKKSGKGYQTRINAVLKAYVAAAQRHHKKRTTS